MAERALPILRINRTAYHVDLMQRQFDGRISRVCRRAASSLVLDSGGTCYTDWLKALRRSRARVKWERSAKRWKRRLRR